MARMAPSVLVLGEDTRSFLSVIRSLGEAGYLIHVVCYDKKSPSLKSKYIETVQYYNYQAFTHDEWLDNVIALIERYQFDLVVPCDERAIYPLWSAKDKLPAQTKLAITNQEVLDTLFDKWETKQIAIACEIPVARGEKLHLSELSYTEIERIFGKRFVIKPLQSFEQTKLDQRQKVAIIDSEEDYLAYKKNILPDQAYLVEDFFTGKGEGLSVFSIEGKVYAAFAHVRVAEPKQGGGSSYRKSIALDAELLKATEAICAHTKLTGVAMFEYRRNLSTNEWILVEVNARFWGSLPLAVFAGVDFPALYVDYLVKDIIPNPVMKYRSDVYARALISDIYEIKREYEIRRIDSGAFDAFLSLNKRFLQIFRVVGPKEIIDSISLKDPKPFYSEVGMLINLFISLLQRKLPFFIRIRRKIAKAALTKLFRINNRRRILFVCYGNIMRSPFAEKCFREIPAGNGKDLDTDSFGFHLHEERESPENAQEAAKALNYDLTEHRSKWLTQMDLKESDIVIYFDGKNRDILHSYYKVHHAFNAADILGEQFLELAEIEDPYGSDLDGVISCYCQIKASVENLVNIYKGVAG